jgi:hypothetical protein
MPTFMPIGSYGQNQALRAHVWAKNGPETSGNGSKMLAQPESATIVEKSKRTHNGPKCLFCSSRHTYGMPKLMSTGSYDQNQALRAHIWAKNGPINGRSATGFGLRNRIRIRTRPSYMYAPGSAAGLPATGITFLDSGIRVMSHEKHFPPAAGTSTCSTNEPYLVERGDRCVATGAWRVAI